MGVTLKTLWKLQMGQNVVASMLTGTRGLKHLITIVVEFHWFSVCLGAQFKGLANRNISNTSRHQVISKIASFTESLLSLYLQPSGGTLLQVPSMVEARLAFLSGKVVSTVMLQLWRSLTTETRLALSLHTLPVQQLEPGDRFLLVRLHSLVKFWNSSVVWHLFIYLEFLSHFSADLAIKVVLEEQSHF